MRASPKTDVHRPTEFIAPARELYAVPPVSWLSIILLPASSRLADSDMVRFRPDYSGGAAPDRTGFPTHRNSLDSITGSIPLFSPFEKRETLHIVCLFDGTP